MDALLFVHMRTRTHLHPLWEPPGEEAGKPSGPDRLYSLLTGQPPPPPRSPFYLVSFTVSKERGQETEFFWSIAIEWMEQNNVTFILVNYKACFFWT